MTHAGLRNRHDVNPQLVAVDLDGTLLDVRARHYYAHRLASLSCGLDPVEPSRYWRLKREGGDVARLLSTDDQHRLSSYDAAFRLRIEEPELLRLDVVFPGVPEWLDRAAARGYRIVIVTSRQSEERTRAQLHMLKVSVSDVVVCGGADKAAALTEASNLRPSIWIGDTEADIDAARNVGSRCVVVTSGLRNGAFLRNRSPDEVHGCLAQVDLDRAPSDDVS
jgi:phosphoglycolate phosphatase